jgi:hypothetical protein
MSRKYKFLYVDAKCSDMCNVEADGPGGRIQKHDYVPKYLGIGGGDYVYLKIDIETGQIANWPELTDEDIEEALKG